jgi:hypothetical protein
MPALEEVECLTDDERDFFSTLKYFFQAQSGYICSNKERIAKGNHYHHYIIVLKLLNLYTFEFLSSLF